MAEPWRTVLASRSLPPGLARGGRLAALVLGVVLVHGLVLDAAKLPWGALARQVPPEPMQVVSVAPGPVTRPGDLSISVRAEPVEALRQAQGERSRLREERSQKMLTATATATATAEPLFDASAPRSEVPSTAPEALPLPATSAGPRPGQAAPRLAAAVPPSLALLYTAQRGAAQGQAQIEWQSEGERYAMSVKVDVPGTPAIDWLSRGHWGSDGLRPERMVEQQRQRAVRAVNFQRDKGVISFSGSPRSTPLGAQAQDRASWLLQLWAWARALPELPRSGQTVQMPVASPRGDVDDWQFEVQAPEQREVAGHRVTLIPLVRSPQRPYDLRVTVWLTDDPAHWPAGVAWGVEPGGVPLQLWLAEWPGHE